MTNRIDAAILSMDRNTIHFGLCHIPVQYIDHFDVLDAKGVACIRLFTNRNVREGYSAIISLHCQTEEKTREAANVLLEYLPVNADPFSSITASKNFETETTSSVSFAVNKYKTLWFRLSGYFSPEQFEIKEGVGEFTVVSKYTETCEIDPILEKMNRSFVNNHIVHKLDEPLERSSANNNGLCTQGSLGKGKERWFEIYSDRITCRCFTEGFKSVETPSSQDEMYLWFLNPEALLT